MQNTLIRTLIASLCLSSGSLWAQTVFPQPRQFILDQTCSAYTSLKKQTNPQPLTLGTPYIALGENKASAASHAYIQLDGGNKWVALSCGHYTDNASITPKDNAMPSVGNTTCLPFFDNENNPVPLKSGNKADITPPPPTLNAFDTAVNQTCGAAGKVVSPTEFKTLLQNHPAVLQNLMQFTHNKVFADRPALNTPEMYLQDLTEVWFNLKAFDHIFCGQPGDSGKIGGLHFYGRYLQLQQSGEACRMDNYRQNEVIPGVIYTMGASMKAADGQIYRHATKGYGLTLNAQDILQAATRAFSENPTTSTESTACTLAVTDDGKAFSTVFVRRVNGIRTFYPDATPSQTDPACQNALQLN